jgi:RNA recognition motif-containing protein
MKGKIFVLDLLKNDHIIEEKKEFKLKKDHEDSCALKKFQVKEENKNASEKPLKSHKKCNISIRKSTRHKDAKACEKGINSTMQKFKSNPDAASSKKDIDKKYNQCKKKKKIFSKKLDTHKRYLVKEEC